MPRDAMTPRSLVGMTMGARKRDARHAPVERFCTNCKIPLRLYDEVEPTPAESAGFIDPDSYACPKCRSETDNLRSDDKRAETRSFYRIGQRLRPCPGCPSCTDLPRLQVIGYARRIGGRVRIDRALDVSGRSVFYVIMFSWRHEGPMQKLRGFETKQLAWEHLQEYWGYRGHLPRLCDGSGVLPARARKVRR